jgi:hypothetical protein
VDGSVQAAGRGGPTATRQAPRAAAPVAPPATVPADSAPIATLVVPERFCGPPGTANGGWISGTVAGYLAGSDGAANSPPAESVLRAPTPLGIPLQVERTDDGVRLALDGATLVEAHPTDPDEIDDPPRFVDLDEAVRASRSYPGLRGHAFPECMVCGPARADGDGLRLFAGPPPGGEPGLVATPWAVHPAFAGGDGTLDRHLVWASLDCPSFWAYYASTPEPDRGVALLARQAVSVAGPVHAGRTYVVTARTDAVDGRKVRGSSALYDLDGRLVAAARALWIRVDLPAGG